MSEALRRLFISAPSKMPLHYACVCTMQMTIQLPHSWVLCAPGGLLLKLLLERSISTALGWFSPMLNNSSCFIILASTKMIKFEVQLRSNRKIIKRSGSSRWYVKNPIDKMKLRVKNSFLLWNKIKFTLVRYIKFLFSGKNKYLTVSSIGYE